MFVKKSVQKLMNVVIGFRYNVITYYIGMFTVQVNKIWHLLLDLLQTYYEDDFRVQLIMINCLNS